VAREANVREVFFLRGCWPGRFVGSMPANVLCITAHK